MKISEELSKLFKEAKSGCALSVSEADDFADALQQAVAENLELKHRLHFHGTLPEYCASCFKADWLAEANTLLRGRE